MKRILVLIVVVTFLAGCALPKYDLKENQSKVKWEFMKSPESEVCYEVMTVIINTGTGVTYSGMSRVEDKFCQ